MRVVSASLSVLSNKGPTKQIPGVAAPTFEVVLSIRLTIRSASWQADYIILSKGVPRGEETV